MGSYIFDFIVNKLEFDNAQEYKYNEIVLAVTFGNITLELKSTKPNNSGFKEGRTAEFDSSIEELATNVETPLIIRVKQLENKIGEVNINWDQNLIDSLAGGSFHSHSQFTDSDILNAGNKIGSISVAIKIYCKCKEDVFKNYGKLADEKGKLNICDEMEQILDPTDVLFVIGDSAGNNRNMLAQCDDTECPTQLDVSRYQIVRGKLLKTADILNPCGNLACCELTNIQTNYDGTGNGTIKYVNDEQQDCSISMWSGSRENSCTMPTRLSCGDFTAMLSGNKQEQNRFQSTCCDNFNSKFTLPGNNKNHLYSTIRDLPGGNNCTVSSIVKQWNTDTIETNNSRTNIADSKCICTCKTDKICPHCRISKVVNKLLQDIKFNKCNPFMPTNAMQTNKNITQNEQCYNVLKEYGSEDSISAEVIPYLSKTLQALKAKYKFTNDDGNKKEQKLESKGKKQNKNINKINVKNIDRNIECCPKDNYRTQQMSFKCNQRRCKQKLKYRSKRNIKYPGVIFGHKTCQGYGSGVPKNMGWLWNKNKYILGKGWKPGAIGKPIKDIMRYFLSDFPADTLLVSNSAKHEKMYTENENSEVTTQKPTLKVIKKNGEYLITMRPLKLIKEIQHCYNPYLNVKPFQFRIIKSPIMIQKREIKNSLKQCGYNKCTCHMPLPLCFCRSFIEKERIDSEVNRILETKEIPNIKDTFVFSDTTDSESELDIEFTPPVGLLKPHLKKQIDIACKETQYNIKDFRADSIIAKLNGGSGSAGKDGAGGKGGGVGGGSGGGANGEAGGRGGGKGGIGGIGGGKGGSGGGGGIGGGKGGNGGGKGGSGGGGGGKGGNGGGKGGSSGGGGKGGSGGGKGGKKGKAGSAGGKGSENAQSKSFQSRKDKLNDLLSVPPPILCMIERKGATVGATARNFPSC